jgi:hypothetical protein
MIDVAYLIQKPVVVFAKRQKHMFVPPSVSCNFFVCLYFCFVPHLSSAISFLVPPLLLCASFGFCHFCLSASTSALSLHHLYSATNFFVGVCCQVFRPGDAILQIKISENYNDLLLLRSIRRRGSEERWRNLEYFSATRRFVGALLEKCASRMITTLLLAQRAHEMRDSKHDPGGPQEMNCRRVRRQMQKSDGRASDETLCARGCLKKINPQLRDAKKILQIFFFLRRICCDFLSFVVVVVVVACLPLSSILQQTLVFLARDLSSVSPPLVPVSDLL